MINMKVYIVCEHIGSITHPQEVYMDKTKALERFYALRNTNSLRYITYSIQEAPMADWEG